MTIDHLAIWTADLEKMKRFYVKYFGAVASGKYTNTTKQSTSYFLHFADSPVRLELMHRPDIITASGNRGMTAGITHFAIALNDKQEVDNLTEQLRKDGYSVYSEPRTTGDGYYESVVLDPEGNHLEITVAFKP